MAKRDSLRVSINVGNCRQAVDETLGLYRCPASFVPSIGLLVITQRTKTKYVAQAQEV